MQVAPTSAARHVQLGLSNDDLLAMYRQMLLARAVDERMWLMQRAGKIAFIISGQGHEGAQVATAWPMRRNQDWMAPYYRSIAATMTFGMSAEDIITAHLAKGDDVSSGGRQMPGHYGARRYNVVSLSSPVGTQVLHAVGIAMGAWVRGDDVVALTQFGEGTANQGEVHEAMNFAGVHRLPVIFVCENNGYAISVPLERQVAGGSVAARAAGYGMPGVVVDGADVLGCYAAAKEAHERARHGEGPTLIEARVVRLTSHSSDDDQRRYRDPAEVEALKERDPIPAFAGELRELGILTDADDERLRAEAKAEIAEASRRAEARPDPDVALAHEHVYVEPIPGGGTPEADAGGPARAGGPSPGEPSADGQSPGGPSATAGGH
jgi:2-oxoisovalerate dehydrogenase E1 component alpha subunit